MIKPEPKYQNSAGRLLAILEKLQNNKSVADQLVPLMLGENPPNDERNKSKVGIRAITELHILYAEFLLDLANADMGNEEKAVLEEKLVSLTSLVYPQAVNQTIRIASDAEKALLEVCATRLQKENIIEESDIKSIRESIQSLREEITELPTDSILRSILLELSRLSEDSINRFNIYGAKGLKRAFKDMLAEVAEIYLQDEENAANLKNTTAWEKAVKHLKLFDSIAAKAMKYRPFLEKASQYLLGD